MEQEKNFPKGINTVYDLHKLRFNLEENKKCIIHFSNDIKGILPNVLNVKFPYNLLFITSTNSDYEKLKYLNQIYDNYIYKHKDNSLLVQQSDVCFYLSKYNFVYNLYLSYQLKRFFNQTLAYPLNIKNEVFLGRIFINTDKLNFDNFIFNELSQLKVQFGEKLQIITNSNRAELLNSDDLLSEVKNIDIKLNERHKMYYYLIDNKNSLRDPFYIRLNKIKDLKYKDKDKQSFIHSTDYDSLVSDSFIFNSSSETENSNKKLLSNFISLKEPNSYSSFIENLFSNIVGLSSTEDKFNNQTLNIKLEIDQIKAKYNNFNYKVLERLVMKYGIKPSILIIDNTSNIIKVKNSFDPDFDKSILNGEIQFNIKNLGCNSFIDLFKRLEINVDRMHKVWGLSKRTSINDIANECQNYSELLKEVYKERKSFHDKYFRLFLILNYIKESQNNI